MPRPDFPWKKLAQTKLDTITKHAIRGRLIVLMDAKDEKSISKPHRPWYFVSMRLFPLPVFVILLAVLVGGGTAFAAEGAIPGEPLYPIKIYVNEEVRAALTVGEEKTAAWELERAQRRAEETLVAEQKGTLDEQLRTQMEKRIEKHEIKTEQLEVRLEQEGHIEAAERVRARVEKYLEVKERIRVNIETIMEEKKEKQLKRDEKPDDEENIEEMKRKDVRKNQKEEEVREDKRSETTLKKDEDERGSQAINIETTIVPRIHVDLQQKNPTVLDVRR